MDHDFSRSRAVLIGAAEYRNHPRITNLNAAANSVVMMHALLTGELCGWPPGRVTVLLDVGSPAELARRVRMATQDAEDAVLVYYSGHGLRTRNGQLALAVADTDPDAEMLPHSAMLYRNLADILRGCRAAAKLVILDCCHAGLADRENYIFQSANAGDYPVEGLYFIGASASDAKARAPLDGSATYFTDAFLKVVRNGIPDGPAELTMDQIFRLLLRRLRDEGLPAPVESGIYGARGFPFARNAALIGAASPERPPPATRRPRRPWREAMTRQRRAAAISAGAALVVAASIMALVATSHGGSPGPLPPPSPSSARPVATTAPASTAAPPPAPAYDQTIGVGCAVGDSAHVDGDTPSPTTHPWTSASTPQSTGKAPGGPAATQCTGTAQYTYPTTHTNPDQWMNDFYWTFDNVPTRSACTFEVYIADSQYSQYTATYYTIDGGASATEENPFTIDQATHVGIWVAEGPFTFTSGTATLELTDTRNQGPNAPMTASATTLICT